MESCKEGKEEPVCFFFSFPHEALFCKRAVLQCVALDVLCPCIEKK